ncbi:MAG TPA: acyltransferase family protein [Telluria sp.]|nr:acyltransferase family protein [Telluria sp.]
MSAAVAYRPDVDGLRAVAVLSVLAFHASAALLPGGFAGVDIFFVISGFLITQLICAEAAAGTFTLGGFYLRRVRRILPAYIAVSLATLAAASWLLIPSDYVLYTTSLAASWGFAANVFFSLSSWGYFGQRSEEYPLLHTWSLSVEEQFYFLFPLLLVWLLRRRRGALLPLAAMCAAGLVLSEWRVERVGSYFLLPYRAHELLLGALAAMLARARPPAGARAAGWCTGAGLVLAGASLFLLNRELRFPGLNSLAPCVGAALVLYGGTRPNRVSGLLAVRPMVAVGLISYSLYLWHWPLFAFLRYRYGAVTPTMAALAALAAFALAALSYRYIEKPARHARLTLPRAALRYYAMPTALFLFVGAWSWISSGIPARFPPATRALIASYSFERDLSGDCALKSGEFQAVSLERLERECAFGAEGEPPSVLLYGDSHANHFKPFVEALARRAGRRAVYFVEGSCSADDLPEDGAPPTACQRRNLAMLELAGRFRYVVLGTLWKYQGQEGQFARRLERVTARIAQAGAVPVLFKTAPWTYSDHSRCVLHRARGWIASDTPCTLDRADVDRAIGRMDAVLDALARRHPGVLVIDPKPLTCSGGRCATNIGQLALYKDANHLNAPAARVLGEQYAARFGNPFRPVTAPIATVTSRLDGHQ